MNVLIDPNWSMWLSVIKRLNARGFCIDNLPSSIPSVLTHTSIISSAHLAASGGRSAVVVPTGVGNLVHDLGFNIVHELDEWQNVQLGPLMVAHVPSLGARMLHDQHRGFGGFVIEGGPLDFPLRRSAYFPSFEDIGQRFPVEVALLPIGAYDAEQTQSAHESRKRCVPFLN
jgi:L-ascorbate metabolism protein UlaG (beta-lactamase superfamily)